MTARLDERRVCCLILTLVSILSRVTGEVNPRRRASIRLRHSRDCRDRLDFGHSDGGGRARVILCSSDSLVYLALRLCALCDRAGGDRSRGRAERRRATLGTAARMDFAGGLCPVRCDGAPLSASTARLLPSLLWLSAAVGRRLSHTVP